MLRTMPLESIVQHNSTLSNLHTHPIRHKVLLLMLISPLVYLLYLLNAPQLLHGIHIKVHGLAVDTSSKWPKVATYMTLLLTRIHLPQRPPVQALLLILATPALSQDLVEITNSCATANYRKDLPQKLHATISWQWRALQESPSDGVDLHLESEGFYSNHSFK